MDFSVSKKESSNAALLTNAEKIATITTTHTPQSSSESRWVRGISIDPHIHPLFFSFFFYKQITLTPFWIKSHSWLRNTHTHTHHTQLYSLLWCTDGVLLFDFLTSWLIGCFRVVYIVIHLYSPTETTNRNRFRFNLEHKCLIRWVLHFSPRCWSDLSLCFVL